MDLAVLLGASGSSADRTFSAQQRFIKKLLDKIDISDKATLLGAIAYGKDAEIKLTLGSVTTRESSKRGIDQIQNPRDGTDIGAALTLAQDALFSTINGARQGVPKSALLFVDKKASGNTTKLIQLSKGMKDKNIKLVIVGIGTDLDRDELKPMAYDSNTIFFPSKLEEMGMLVKPVTKAILPGKN